MYTSTSRHVQNSVVVPSNWGINKLIIKEVLQTKHPENLNFRFGEVISFSIPY